MLDKVLTNATAFARIGDRHSSCHQAAQRQRCSWMDGLAKRRNLTRSEGLVYGTTTYYRHACLSSPAIACAGVVHVYREGPPTDLSVCTTSLVGVRRMAASLDNFAAAAVAAGRKQSGSRCCWLAVEERPSTMAMRICCGASLLWPRYGEDIRAAGVCWSCFIAGAGTVS